jgi:hypothetical protein
MNQQDDLTPNRYPNLGKLSVAILDEYVKKVIGEEAIKELKSPLQQKVLSDSLAKALKHAEDRFISEHRSEDKEIADGIMQLPIASMPSFGQAVWSFAERPSDPELKTLLKKQLDSDFPSLAIERKERVVDVYLNILRQELISISAEMREKLMAMAVFDIDEQIKQILKNFLEFIGLWKQEQQKPVIRGSIPPLPQLVIGRENDIKELKHKIGLGVEGQTTTVLTAIRGWPGVGKTTIAAVLAYDPDIATAFPDGVLWVSLGQEPNILAEMTAWGRTLGTDELLKARNIQEAQAQLSALLRNKCMLLLIDDVWQSEHAIPFNIGGPKCTTLITTRLNDVARELAPSPENIYLLPVLSDESAMELMSILAPSVVQNYRDDVLLLVHELEGLPLALQVAGRLLQSEASIGFDVKELIKELRESARILEEEAPPDRADLVKETTPKIAALLQKSTDLLDDFTRDCYAYLGVFAPKPATFDLDAMAYVWEVENPRDVVKKLVDYGLLEYVFELDRFQMHALLVTQAKSLLTED